MLGALDLPQYNRMMSPARLSTQLQVSTQARKRPRQRDQRTYVHPATSAPAESCKCLPRLAENQHDLHHRD